MATRIEPTTHAFAHYTAMIDGTPVDILPTPMLLDQVGRRFPGTLAYEQTPADDRYPAVWRMRDPDYDAPGTEYHLITRILRKD